MSVVQVPPAPVESSAVPRLYTPEPAEGPSLKDLDPLLSAYRQPSLVRSLWQLTTTVTLFVASWTLAYLSLSVSWWLTMAMAFPTAMLIIRMFIFQHDCGHRSFFRSKRANDLVGQMLSVITLTPYHAWRREHAMHHASSGDLDRRGRAGEIWTMTLQEYREASWLWRFTYRGFRNPFVLFVIGPFIQFVFRQRFAFELPKEWKRERRNVYLTNLGILCLFGTLSWFLGLGTVLAIQLPVMAIASSVGVWLFYIQHQYEDAFWENNEDWDYVQAALAGSSHLRLPKWLQWFTGNIGLHHIHHLDARIPNYQLQACHDNNPELQDVVELTLWSSLGCANMKLWDESQRKMVGFKAAREPAS